jgi:glutamyl-tRNA synthetase
MSEVRVRIAPSPTGFFHFGLARTALYNYLYAKKMGGAFVLRLEDTDKARSTKEYEQDIYECFEWLGLTFDEKYIQTQHVERHKELLQKLVAEDKAYISKELAKDDSGREVEVVRLRNPGKSITFTDVIRGDITFDTTELKDFVIARSIDDPLYHFAVVADDGDANITHIIRGEDHISNTPRQILIQEALGLPRPIYAHLPLILAPDRTKMSKRKHQTAMREFRKQGYLPEALINFTALLGWSEGAGDKEVYSMQELIEAFSLEGIHKSGAVFNEEKLRWFNRHYLLQQPEEVFMKDALSIMKIELEERGVAWDNGRAESVMPIIRERISILEDLRMLLKDGEFDYFFSAPTLDAARIPEKKSTVDAAKKHLEFALETLESLSDFSAESIKNALWEYAGNEGRGAVLWPLRYTLSGRDKSPDPFMIASIIGKEETITRIRGAVELL